MVTVKQYVRGNGSEPKFARAYRESLLYVMINYIDDHYRRMDGSQTDIQNGITYQPLTVAQKRRYRNAIVSKAQQMVNNHNAQLSEAQANGERLDEQEIHMHDADVLIRAAFSTPPGDNYVDKMDDWLNHEKLASLPVDDIRRHIDIYMNNIKACTADQTYVIPLSPYDPLFAQSDAMTEADQIGYVTTMVKEVNGASVPDLDANGKYRWDPDLKIGDDGVITRAYFGRAHGIAAPRNISRVIARCRNEAEEKGGELSDRLALYGDLHKCGYMSIEPYIRTVSAKRHIRDFLLKEMNEYAEDGLEGSEQSPEEYAFIDDVCNYLSEHGMKFEVKLDTSGHLSAFLDDGGIIIRLLDRENPSLRGRIFDHGRVFYMNADTGVTDVNDRKVATNASINNNHCINMLRWYFGEKVPVDVDASLSYQPGVRALANSMTGELVEWQVGKGEKQTTVRIAKSRTNSKNSVLLALSTDDKGRAVPVKIMSNPSVVSDASSLDILPFSNSLHVTRGTFGETMGKPMPEDQSAAYRKNLRERLPDNKIFPDDIDTESDDAEVVTLDDGTQVYRYPFKSAAQMRVDIHSKTSDPDEVNALFNQKIEYYQHLLVRETLNEWVESAKDRHSKEVDIDRLVSEFDSYGDIPDEYVFDFSDREDVASLQKMYWDALSGKRSELQFDDIDGFDGDTMSIPVGETREERLEAIRLHYEQFKLKFFGNVPEIVRDGIPVSNDGVTGFNPTNVASYVDCEYAGGIQRNIDFIEHMLLSLGSDYSDDYIKGDDSYATKLKNKMLKFDTENIVAGFKFSDIQLLSKPSNIKESYAVDMSKFNDPSNKNLAGLRDKPVTRNLMIHMAQSFVKSGCDPASIALEIDANGVIRYTANTYADLSKKEVRQIRGSLGQITEPGEFGEIKPATRVDKGKVYIPGYDAFFVPNDVNDSKTDEERLRCIGYEQHMRNRISECVHNAVFTLPTEYNILSHTTDLNTVYSHMTSMAEDAESFYKKVGRGVDLDSVSQYEREQIEFHRAVIETECKRIRFPNSYGDEASSRYALLVDHPELDPNSAYDYTTGDLCGHNMRCMDNLQGCCSLLATGVGGTQGIVRFLKDGVEVKPDGTVTTIEGGDCAIMNMDVAQYAKMFNPANRVAMLTNAMLSSQAINRNTGVALMTANGYTMDDGVVISKNFAETHMVKGKDGEYRPMKRGDKVTDANGNKGTISIVIDGDARPEGPDANLITLFKDNPSLDMIMSPYSPLSRYNGGTLHEMHANQGSLILEKKDADGNVYKETVEGGMGFITTFTMKQSVDSKSTVYDDDLPEGRNASPQLAWVLNAQRVNAVIQEMYGDNSKGINKAREYCIALGLDMDEQMALRGSYKRQVNESRKLMKLGGSDGSVSEMDTRVTDILGTYDAECTRAAATSKSKTVDVAKIQASAEKKFDNALKSAIKDITKQSRRDIMRDLNKSGGFIEIPFELQYNEVNRTAEAQKATAPIMYTPRTGQTYDVYTVNEQGERATTSTKPTYGVPVLPASMRSGHNVNNGVTSGYDYGGKYAHIYEQAEIYRHCEQALSVAANEYEKSALLKVMIEAQAQAQADLDYVQKDIVDRFINNKHNIVTDGIMTHKQSHSATMVWTADPKLDLDEIGMSRDTARKLGLLRSDETELSWNNRTLVWRDPCISTGALRYLRIRLDDELTGVAINPMSDASFEGDFDGDTAGLKALMTRDAIMDAINKLAMEANLLNTNSVEEIVDTRGYIGKPGETVKVHSLYIQWGMDVVAAAHANPEIAQRKDELTLKINRLENNIKEMQRTGDTNRIRVVDENGDVTAAGMDAAVIWRRTFMKELNELVHDAQYGVGLQHMVVKDAQSIAECCNEIVSSGAKGSPETLQKLLDQSGIEVDENGKYSFVKDENGEYCSTYWKNGTYVDVIVNDQTLSSIKTDFTGDSGSGTKDVITAFRNINAEAERVASEFNAFKTNSFLTAGLNSTRENTQGLMSAKKSAEEGSVKAFVLMAMLKNIYDGNKMMNMDPNTDKDLLLKQPHTVIRTPVTDKQNRPVLDENGNQKMRAQKCTVAEYCKQFEVFGKLYGAKFNMNEVKSLANAMCDEHGYVTGITAFGRSHGSLMDAIGYGRNKSFANMCDAALHLSERDNRLLPGVSDVAESYIKTFDGIKAAEKQIKSGANSRETMKAKEQLFEYREQRRKLYSEMSNCAAFAPRSAMTAAANHIVMERYDESDPKYIEAEVKFKPLGCRDVFLTRPEIAMGVGIMGETQFDYALRLENARHIGQPVDDDEIANVKGMQTVTVGASHDNIFDEQSAVVGTAHKGRSGDGDIPPF